MGGSRGGHRGPDPPLKNRKNIGFHSKHPDLQKKHKATKPAFNVGPSQHTSKTPCKWPFAGGPMLARILWYLDPLSLTTKKTLSKLDPLWQNFLDPRMNGHSRIDKTKILMTDGSLMKVETNAECSKGNILQYF